MSDQFLEPEDQGQVNQAHGKEESAVIDTSKWYLSRPLVFVLLGVIAIVAMIFVATKAPEMEDAATVFEQTVEVANDETASQEVDTAVTPDGPTDLLDADADEIQGQRVEGQLIELTQAVTALSNQTAQSHTTLNSIQKSIQQLGQAVRDQETRLVDIETTVSTLQGELLSIRAAQKENEFTEERRQRIAGAVVATVNQDLKAQLGIDALLARIAQQEREIERMRLQMQAITSHSAVPSGSLASSRTLTTRDHSTYNNIYTDPSDLPFEIVSIDIWDNTPSVTIAFSGKLAVITPGEQRMRWVLRNVDPSRRVAVFQNLDTGQNVTMRAS